MRLFLDGKPALAPTNLQSGEKLPSLVGLTESEKAKLDSVQYGATSTPLGTTAGTAAAGNDARLGTIYKSRPNQTNERRSVLHGIQPNLKDFGAVISEPLSTDWWSGGPSEANGGGVLADAQAIWAINNSVFQAFLDAGGGEIDQGRYYISASLLITLANTKLIGLGEGVEIYYGPGLPAYSIPLAAPLVHHNGPLDRLRMSHVMFEGLAFTEELFLGEGGALTNASFDHCSWGRGGVAFWSFSAIDVATCNWTNCSWSVALFGIRLRNSPGNICQKSTFCECSWSSWYRCLRIEGSFNNLIQFCTADMFCSNAFTAYGPQLDVHELADTSAFEALGGGNTTFENCWAEAYGDKAGRSFYSTGDGNQLIRNVSVNMADPSGSWTVTSNRVGVSTAAVVQQTNNVRGEDCPFMGSPDATVTWSWSTMMATTAATTQCTAYFALPQTQSSWPRMLTSVLAYVYRAAVAFAADISIMRKDRWSQTAPEVVGTATLAANGFNALTRGAVFFADFSPVWDGWCGDREFPVPSSGDTLRYTYFLRIRCTPGADGAITIGMPAVKANHGVSEPEHNSAWLLENMGLSAAELNALWVVDDSTVSIPLGGTRYLVDGVTGAKGGNATPATAARFRREKINNHWALAANDADTVATALTIPTTGQAAIVVATGPAVVPAPRSEALFLIGGGGGGYSTFVTNGALWLNSTSHLCDGVDDENLPADTAIHVFESGTYATGPTGPELGGFSGSPIATYSGKILAHLQVTGTYFARRAAYTLALQRYFAR